jgi:hypothetical protein
MPGRLPQCIFVPNNDRPRSLVDLRSGSTGLPGGSVPVKPRRAAIRVSWELDEVVERLLQRFPGVQEERVCSVVIKVHETFVGNPIRDFVPVFCRALSRVSGWAGASQWHPRTADHWAVDDPAEIGGRLDTRCTCNRQCPVEASTGCPSPTM